MRPGRSAGVGLLTRWRRGCGGLLALVIALAASPVQALSLSELKSVSALGEPLRLELIIEAERDIPPKVRLLPAGENGRIDLESLRFQLEPIDREHQRLLILSSRPVWEPAIELSVEVAHDQMRIRRDLSVLLDLPGTAVATTRPVVPRRAAAAPVAVPVADDVPVAIVAAAEPVAPRVASTPRKSPRRSSPSAAITLQPPPPRFQLSERLSDNWAELIALPAPAASSLPEPEPSESTGAMSRIDASPLVAVQAAERPAAAAARVTATRVSVPALPPLDERIQRARSIDDAGSLSVESPWLLFFLMAGLATAMFLQARRLRRQMMREGELLPA